MAKIQSTVRQINRRITEIYNYFGYSSQEYMEAKNLLYTAFPDADIFLSESKSKALGFSRGKNAMRAYEFMEDEMKEVWKNLREMGTVKQMAEKYMTEEDKAEVDYRDSDIIDEIRKRSKQRLESKYVDSDLYITISNEIALQEMYEEEGNELFDEDYLNDLRNTFDKYSGQGIRRDIKLLEIESEFNSILSRNDRTFEDIEEERNNRDRYSMGRNS